MNLFEFVFDVVGGQFVDRLGVVGGILAMLVLVPTLVYLPAVPLGLVEERRRQAAAGTGPGPSATLTFVGWCSALYYVVLFFFGVVPYFFGTVLPGLWRSVIAVFPFAQGLFSGTSGLILSALASIVGLVLFFVLAGWAFRLGWRLQDRIR